MSTSFREGDIICLWPKHVGAKEHVVKDASGPDALVLDDGSRACWIRDAVLIRRPVRGRDDDPIGRYAALADAVQPKDDEIRRLKAHLFDAEREIAKLRRKLGES